MGLCWVDSAQCSVDSEQCALDSARGRRMIGLKSAGAYSGSTTPTSAVPMFQDFRSQPQVQGNAVGQNGCSCRLNLPCGPPAFRHSHSAKAVCKVQSRLVLPMLSCAKQSGGGVLGLSRDGRGVEAVAEVVKTVN